jgi:SAM-dependent methyltransferase
VSFFHYLRYFFYLAANWNVRLAWYVVRHEIKGEKKYGIRTTGADELKSLRKKGIDTSHATLYMPVVYPILETLLAQIPAAHKKYFIDIGCGKGRALCVAAHAGFARVTGIDFSAAFCKAAEENLALTAQKTPGFEYQVLNNDAFYFDIPDTADCIFLFNPFDEVIMSGVVKNIEDSLARAPRPLYIIYANPVCKPLFTEAGFKEVFYTCKLDYLEGVVMGGRMS